jgi:hypothetical protein
MRKYLVFGLGSVVEYHARSCEHAELLLVQDFPDVDVFSGSVVVIAAEYCEAE